MYKTELSDDERKECRREIRIADAKEAVVRAAKDWTVSEVTDEDYWLNILQKKVAELERLEAEGSHANKA